MTVSMFYFGPNITNETAAATTQGWHNFSASLVPYGVVSAEQMIFASSWYELLHAVFGSSVFNGKNAMFTSRLLSRDTVATKAIEVAEVLLGCTTAPFRHDCPSSSSARLKRQPFYHISALAGGRVNQTNPGIEPSPAVCDRASSVCVLVGGWRVLIGPPREDFSAQGMDQGVARPHAQRRCLLRQASLFEIDWQKTFFGSHYSSLKNIKDKYDLHRLFVVAEGVGSEEWKEDLTCSY